MNKYHFVGIHCLPAGPAQRGPGRRDQGQQGHHPRHVPAHHRHHPGRGGLGRPQDQDRGRLLRRRRRHHRHPERLGDRRRLHVGRLVPRYFRPDLPVRLRRLHVLGRLAGGLHHGSADRRRTVPQRRQVHPRRHPLLPHRSQAGARRGRHLHRGRLDLLPDRPDGRRRQADGSCWSAFPTRPPSSASAS